MAAITTRQTSGGGATVKGTPLTNGEMDTNLINLNIGQTTAVDITGGTISGITSLGVSGTSTLNDIIVSVNTSTDAVRITQTGSGNALVVEDSANPDSSPIVMDNNGRLIVGSDTSQTLNNLTASFQVNGTAFNNSTLSVNRFNATAANSPSLTFGRSRGATIGTNTSVASGDTIGTILFRAADGTSYVDGASITAQVDGTPATNDMPGRLVFLTTPSGSDTPTERMRIDSVGAVKIGSSSSTVSLIVRVGGNTKPVISNETQGVYVSPIIQSDATSAYAGVYSHSDTAATAFTLTNLRHFYAAQGTIGDGSVITNQYGFAAASNIIGATNNYGFYSNIASGTGRWNFYAAGTASNYFAGTTLFSNTSSVTHGTLTSTALQVSTNGATNAGLSITNWGTAGGNSAKITFGRSPSGTVGTLAAVSNGSNLMELNIFGNDGTNFVEAAKIASQIDGTPATNDMPGRLLFFTTPSGSSTPVERMRINNAGNISIATSTSEATLTINGNAKFGRTTGGIPSTGTKLTLEADSLDGISTPVELLRLGWTDSPNFDQSAGAGTKISFYQPSATVANEVAYIGSSKFSNAEDDQGASITFATSATGSTSSTAPTEAMRINNYQNIGIGNAGSSTVKLNVNGTYTNGTEASAIRADGTILSDITSAYIGFYSRPSTLAAAFTLTGLYHFYANPSSSYGAGSTVTNQYGFFAQNNLIGATNNYGFYSNIAATTGRWNFYANGTASNYFAGITSVGGVTQVSGVTASTPNFQVHGTSLATAQQSTTNWANSVTSPVITMGKSRGTSIGTHAAVLVDDGIGALLGLGSDGTNFIQGARIDFLVDGTPGTSAMPGRITLSTTPSGSATPVERMRITSAGNIGLGTTSLTGITLHNAINITGAVTSRGIRSAGTIQSDVTSSGRGFESAISTQATTFTLTELVHFYAQQGTIGLGSTVTNQFGFLAQDTLTGATNNYGFYSNIASAAGRWNFYANGTASNYFAGQTILGANSPLTWDTGNNYSIRSDASTFLRFDTAGSERMRIDSSGNVGIGNTNPGAPLAFGTSVGTAGDANRIRLYESGANTYGFGISNAQLNIRAGDTGNVVFYTSTTGTATERMRITNAGNVGIGTTAPAVPLNAVGSIYSDNYATAPRFFGRRAQGTLASPTATTSGVSLAEFLGVGYTGSAFASGSAAGMVVLSAEAHTSSAQGNHVLFYTAPTGSTTSAERMRIDSSGNVGIGTSSPTGKLEVAAGTDKNLNIDASGIGSSLRISAINDAANANVNLTIQSSNTIFASSGTEYMRIDSSGNVLIGATSALSKFQVSFGDAAGNAISLQNTNTGANTTKYSGINYFGTDTVGTNKSTGYIRVVPIDSNYVDSSMVFATRGSDATAERMRIDSSGNVLIGKTQFSPLTGTPSWTWDQILTGQGNVTEITFKPDGTKLFVCRSSDILTYNLSTAWDLSTATLAHTYTIPWDTATQGIYFDSTGTKLVTVGQTAVVGALAGVVASEDRAWYATLSVAYDLSSTVTLTSTLRFAAGDAGLVAAETAPSGVDFKPDGLVMFVVGTTLDKVQQYTLTTAFDVSTATWSKEYTVGDRETGPSSIQFNSTGLKMYIIGTTGDDINEYQLTSAYDIGTITSVTNKVFIGDREFTPTSIYVSNSNYAFIGGSSTDAVQRYRTDIQGMEIKSEPFTTAAGATEYAPLDIYGDVTFKRLSEPLAGSVLVDKNFRVTGAATVDSNLSVSGSITISGDLTVSGNDLVGTTTSTLNCFATQTTGGVNLATSQTTGVITVGGTGATGAITIGRATTAQTVNIGIGATASATVKQIIIGSAGVSGSTTVVKIGSNVSGAVSDTLVNGTLLIKQPASTDKAAAATLTIAELRTGIITQSLSGGTLTLPSGTDMDGGFASDVLENNMAFNWTVINTSAGAVSVAAGASGHTITGNASVAATSSATFRSRRTATTTWISYRIS